MSEYGLDLTPDGIGDEVTEGFKMALLIAARLAEKVVERISQQSRDAERQAEEGARAGREQLQAHRALARAACRDVGTDRWWEGAGPAEVARAWQMARPWEEHDPELARTTQDLREGLESRYGVPDPDGWTRPTCRATSRTGWPRPEAPRPGRPTRRPGSR